MSLGLITGEENERHLCPGSLNSVVSDKGQAPRPTTETIHSNGFHIFTGAEYKLYARCCDRIWRRVNTEQFISQNVRTPRRQAHLSWDSCFRPGDPEEPVTCSVAQVSHLLSQTSSHYNMVAFTGSEPPPPASASPRTVRGGGTPICFSSYRQMLCLTGPSQIPPIKNGIRYKIPLV